MNLVYLLGMYVCIYVLMRKGIQLKNNAFLKVCFIFLVSFIYILSICTAFNLKINIIIYMYVIYCFHFVGSYLSMTSLSILV